MSEEFRSLYIMDHRGFSLDASGLFSMAIYCGEGK